jgi:hypothetical protein
MKYTVWSRGRLVGETDLGYAQFRPNLRAGDFFPSEEGQKLMPVATESHTLSRGQDSDPETKYADMMSAYDRCEALMLELRGEDGRVIDTEWIAIRDTEMILSSLSDDELDLDDFTSAYDPELEATIQHDADLIAEWFGDDDDSGDLELDGTYDWLDQPDFPRYQVLVELREPRGAD